MDEGRNHSKYLQLLRVRIQGGICRVHSLEGWVGGKQQALHSEFALQFGDHYIPMPRSLGFINNTQITTVKPNIGHRFADGPDEVR